MVHLKCEYEIENKVNKDIEISSEQGLKLLIRDERGEILQIECSYQPLTTATRVTIHGEMSIVMQSDAWRQTESVEKGVVIIKRV